MGVSPIHSSYKSQRNPLHPYLSCICKTSTRLRKDRQHISGRKRNPLRPWRAKASKSCSFRTIAHADWSKPCPIDASIREMRSILPRLWAWSLVWVFGKEKHLDMREICTLRGCPVIVPLKQPRWCTIMGSSISILLYYEMLSAVFQHFWFNHMFSSFAFLQAAPVEISLNTGVLMDSMMEHGRQHDKLRLRILQVRSCAKGHHVFPVNSTSHALEQG